MNARGLFVSFEGGEGAGKSTVLAATRSWLERHGIPHCITREPGGTPLAEALRALVLDPRGTGVTPETETLMMFAARAHHVATLIVPKLASGAWVISDRFTDASYAYQGGGRGMAHPTLAQLEQIATGGLEPDLTLLLDVPVGEGMRRVAHRGAPDRMESEAEAFFERVRTTYLERASAAPSRFRVIDATQPLPQVIARVEREFEALRARGAAVSSREASA